MTSLKKRNDQQRINKRYETRDQEEPNYFESEVESEPEEQGAARPLPAIKQPEMFNREVISETSSLVSLPSISSMKDDLEDNLTFLSRSEWLIEVPNHIQAYTGNVVCFVDSEGVPLDEGAKILQEQGKIPLEMNMKVCEIEEFVRQKNKRYFVVCLEKKQWNYSLHVTCTGIYRALTILRDLLIKLGQSGIGLARSKDICGLTFEEIINLFSIVFTGQNIRIIICSGTLKYVPKEKRDELFHEMHECPVGGYREVSKTYNRIRVKYYWENLKEDIQRRIQQCLPCQIKKLVRLKTKQPMVITDTPGIPFHKVALDIVGPLDKTANGNEYILTLQDQFSKFCMAIPLADTTASSVADGLIKRFICYFGIPRVILTNQGSNFMSSLFQKVAKRFKIKKVKTTAYHPHANGSLERSHAMLGEYLKQYTSTDQE